MRWAVAQCCALLLAPVPTLAQESTTPGLNVQTYAEQIIVRVDEAGVAHRALVRASIVQPGDELIYTVRFTNTGNKPLVQPVIVRALPLGMRYVEGSAVGPGVRIDYSVDGGKHWGRPEELVVPGVDEVPRPAQSRDYTHLRWQLDRALAPGATGYLRFRARME